MAYIEPILGFRHSTRLLLYEAIAAWASCHGKTDISPFYAVFSLRSYYGMNDIFCMLSLRADVTNDLHSLLNSRRSALFGLFLGRCDAVYQAAYVQYLGTFPVLVSIHHRSLRMPCHSGAEEGGAGSQNNRVYMTCPASGSRPSLCWAPVA